MRHAVRVAVHDELTRLAAVAGPGVFETPDGFRAAFDDFVEEGSATAGELALLTDAIGTGALRRLLDQLDLGAAPASAVDGQARLLASARGTTETDGAAWALAALAHALGRVGPAEVTRHRRTPAPPAPPRTPPPPVPRPSAPAPRPRSRALPLTLAAAAVLLLVAGVVAVVVLTRGDDDDGRRVGPTDAATGPAAAVVSDAERTSALDFARQATPAVIGYDWRSFDADVRGAKALMTADQAERYEGTVSSIRDKVIRDRVTSVAEVLDAGLVGIDAERARVLVFLDQHTTRSAGDPGAVAQSVAVSLVRSGEAWLVDDLVLQAVADDEPGEPDATRREVLAAATAFGRAFLNVDHRTVDADTTEILDLTTGGFHDLYAAGLDDLRSLTRAQETTLTGEVWAAGLVELDGDRALVVAATSGTATSKGTGGQEQERDYRVRLTLDRVGEEWLTSDLQYVTSPS